MKINWLKAILIPAILSALPVLKEVYTDNAISTHDIFDVVYIFITTLCSLFMSVEKVGPSN
jgi:hypothetical protein